MAYCSIQLTLRLMMFVTLDNAMIGNGNDTLSEPNVNEMN